MILKLNVAHSLISTMMKKSNSIFPKQAAKGMRG
jgi:hypothetical protein